MTSENLVYSLVGLVIGLFVHFLFRYFGKKGENLATKEDITAITDKMEIVKHEYAKQLESAKAELTIQLSTNSFRYEKEYEILKELMSLLFDVKDACLKLRPQFDIIDISRSDDERKKERLSRFFQARWELYLAREKKRPFYPDSIYKAFIEIDKLVFSESNQYRYLDPKNVDKSEEYWEKATENQEAIESKVELAIEEIRIRVNKWESLIESL